MINSRIFFLVVLLEFLSTEISVTAHILTSRFQLDDDYDNSIEKDLPVCETTDELIPHMQCFLYYTCENSEPKLTLCQQPLYFNTKTGKCDLEDNVHDCFEGIRVLPGSKPPFFTHLNPFRSTTPSTTTKAPKTPKTTEAATTLSPSTTTETTTEKSTHTTAEATTTKTASPGKTKTTKYTPPPTSTVTKTLENETDTKTTPIPLTTESKIVTLRKYVSKFPIFSTKMTPNPVDHDFTITTPTSFEPVTKKTTILEYETTTPKHTTPATTITMTTSPSTTSTTSTSTTTTTTTTRMPERGCQPIKIIIHHYPGPCKAEFTCSDGSSFLVEHCTSHLLWRPARIPS